MIRRLRTTASVGFALGLAAVLLAAQPDVRAAADPSEDRASPPRTCQGERATITGNKQSDLLMGTLGRDVVWAGLGADTVLGLEGNDLVCGGRGADVLIGGVGRDKLYGQGQTDYCHGERREHQHHDKCEMHFNNLGEEVDPPAARLVTAPAETSALVMTARAPAATRRAAAAYFNVDSPLCDVQSPLMDVYLGNAYFQTQYTNPGRVAILPYYYRWGSNSSFLDGPYYPSNWLVYEAPADGQVYSVDMGATHVPRSDGRIILMYAIWWSNGAEWVDGTNLLVNHHYLQYATGPQYTGAVGCLAR